MERSDVPQPLVLVAAPQTAPLVDYGLAGAVQVIGWMGETVGWFVEQTAADGATAFDFIARQPPESEVSDALRRVANELMLAYGRGAYATPGDVREALRVAGAQLAVPEQLDNLRGVLARAMAV